MTLFGIFQASVSIIISIIISFVFLSSHQRSSPGQSLAGSGVTSPRSGMTSPRSGMTSLNGSTSPHNGMASPRRGMTSPHNGMTSPQSGLSSLPNGGVHAQLLGNSAMSPRLVSLLASVSTSRSFMGRDLLKQSLKKSFWYITPVPDEVHGTWHRIFRVNFPYIRFEKLLNFLPDIQLHWQYTNIPRVSDYLMGFVIIA